MRSPQKPDEQQRAVVPTDPVNESVVIAAVCVDRKTADALLPVYTPDFFYARGHGKIWETLQEMQRRGLYYDAATVQQMSAGEVDSRYLATLIAERPAKPPNLQHHIEALTWDRARIEAVRGPIAQLIELVKDPRSFPERVRAMAKHVGEAFVGLGSSAYITPGATVAERQMRVIRERSRGRACYSYGIPDLDDFELDGTGYRTPRMVPGSAPGNVTLITGTSGSGKSTLISKIVVGILESPQPRRILMGSWEQGQGPTLEVMAAIKIGMSRTDLTAGRYDELDEAALKKAMDELAPWIDFFALPFGKARGEKQFNDRNIDLIVQVIQDSRCEIFIADLMRRAFKETDPDDEEQALFRLQAEGQRLGVHQIWAHQQRLKDVENRVDRRPTREGLKGSGAWIEVPDTIIGVHREALWKPIPDDRLELLVLKQRWGRWPLAVEFEWDSEFVLVENGRSIEMKARDEGDLDSLVGGKRYSK